jgi:hypothetical protein
MFEWISTSTASTATTTCYYPLLYTSTSATTSTYCQQVNPTWIRYYYSSQYEDPEVWLQGQRRLQARQFERHTQEARDRAMELLIENLTAEQRSTFEKNKWFVVVGGKSGQKYRIHANDNVAANIDVLDGDSVRRRLCGHCDISRIPLGDHILAQKMMLEMAEDDFLRIANKHAS